MVQTSLWSQELDNKNSGYGLNTATTKDAQGDITSDPDKVTQTSNGIFDQTLLSYQTIREVYVESADEPKYWHS